MRLILIIIFIVGKSNFSCAQAKAVLISQEEFKEALQGIGKFYNETESYRFNVYYASYKGHESVTPFEESNGYILKSGTKFYAEMLGVKTIQSDKYMVTIQPEGNQLIINNAQTSFNNGYNMDDLTKGLSKTTKIEKTILGNSTSYFIYYKEPSPTSYTEIAINKMGFIEKISIYYSKKIDWENDEGKTISSQPKLEIKYTNFQKNMTISSKEFDLSKYIEISQTEVKPSVHYKDYEFIDLRIKN